FRQTGFVDLELAVALCELGAQAFAACAHLRRVVEQPLLVDVADAGLRTGAACAQYQGCGKRQPPPRAASRSSTVYVAVGVGHVVQAGVEGGSRSSEHRAEGELEAFDFVVPVALDRVGEIQHDRSDRCTPLEGKTGGDAEIACFPIANRGV